MTETHAFERLAAVTMRLPKGLHVLDAGCGFQLPIPLDAATVTGIDISPAALARNEHAHEKILGDITTYPLPRSEYDAVVCWDVIEHLRDPRAALRNLAPTLKPGGLLIVGLPELFSAKASSRRRCRIG